MDIQWFRTDRLPAFQQFERHFIVTGEMDRDGDEEISSRSIELSPQDLKIAARLLTLILNAPPTPRLTTAEMGAIVQTPASSQSPTQDQLHKLATSMFYARKRRDQFFHRGLFGEAAWDVLLTLYIMDQHGPRLTIGTVSKVADVPTATILRWLQTLEDQGLTERQPHPHDKRSALIRIAPKGREAMEAYLSETLVYSA